MTATDIPGLCPATKVPVEWAELDERRNEYRRLTGPNQQLLVDALKTKGNHWVADCIFGSRSFEKLDPNKDVAILRRAFDIVDDVFREVYNEELTDDHE